MSVRGWPHQSWHVIFGLVAAAIGILVFVTGKPSLGSFFGIGEGPDKERASTGESGWTDPPDDQDTPSTPESTETFEAELDTLESPSTADEFPDDEADEVGQHSEEAQTVFYLADLDQVEGSPGSGGATMRRETYVNSIWFGINTFQNDVKWATYVLPTASKTFDATIGFSDESEPGAQVYFQIFLDQNPVSDGHTLMTGEVLDLPTVSVEGAHHLKVEITFLEAGDVGSNGHAVWGNAKVEK